MIITASDFDEAYKTKACEMPQPKCEAPNCFIASYPPVTKPGEHGKFFVNTYLLQPNRYQETLGPATVRSEDFKC